jgi:hypothetical protein
MLQLMKKIDDTINEESFDISDPRYQDTDMLKLIVSSLMRINNITVRMAVYLTEADLRDIFLGGARKGGKGDGSRVLELIDSDQELERIANHLKSNSPAAGDIRIRRIFPAKPGMFKFSQLIDTTGISHGTTDVVLVNLPKQVFEKIRESANDVSSPEKKKEFRKQLELMFNYRYYLMSLDLNEAKKISKKMNMGSNEESWAEAFNPFRVIKNYPVKSQLDAAKNAWNETQNPDITSEKETQRLERSAERAERAREAAKKTMGSSSDLENAILSSILSSANSSSGFNANRVAVGLKNILKNAHSKEDIMGSLEKLNNLGSSKVQQVKDAMSKITGW